MEVGSLTPIHSKRACVLYDGTGRIHHVHTVVTFVGGREPSTDEIAADAKHAFSLNPKKFTGALEHLHVSEQELEHGKKYKVDVAGKKLALAK